MKYLILGASGMAGHLVSIYLKEKGHDVENFDLTGSGAEEGKACGAVPTDRLGHRIKDGCFDAVVNCEAVINQSAEDNKALAAYINTFLPHYLEALTAGTKTIVVHRSTDCIFSGSRGGYKLDDWPDAKSFYARSKAAGELDNGKDITIRTSLIGPEREEAGTGLLNWFLKQRDEVPGYANALWSGITTLEYSREVEYLVEHKAHGVFQCVPGHVISKYRLLELFGEFFEGDRHLVRVENERTDKSLVQELGQYGLEIPDYREMLSRMARWISAHTSLYPAYYKIKEKTSWEN